MGAFANGKYAIALCDRCGQQYDFHRLREEWNGLMTCPECFETKHPQLDPPHHNADPQALFNLSLRTSSFRSKAFLYFTGSLSFILSLFALQIAWLSRTSFGYILLFSSIIIPKVNLFSSFFFLEFKFFR